MIIRSPFPDVEIPDVSITDFVLADAGERGDKSAFIDAPSGRTLSYGQLADSVPAAAAGLAGRGFAKGDVFAHYAPNLPEYAVAFHAVAMAGRVNTTANPLLTAGELAAQRGFVRVGNHEIQFSGPITKLPWGTRACRAGPGHQGCGGFLPTWTIGAGEPMAMRTFDVAGIIEILVRWHAGWSGARMT